MGACFFYSFVITPFPSDCSKEQPKFHLSKVILVLNRCKIKKNELIK